MNIGITVAELSEYQRRAEKLLSAKEREDIVNYLAAFPKDGDLIRDTGGVRKLRWRRSGRGKSAGVRVIYYFHSESIPIYLLTVFAKNERDDLTQRERNDLAKLVKVLIETALE